MNTKTRKAGLILGLLLGWAVMGLPANAQQKYWVVLRDKKGVSFDPYKYFDKKAIERRQRQHLPLFDETDKPINSKYFRQVTSAVDSVSGSSRWLNAMACFAKSEQIEALRKLAFVREIIPFSERPAELAETGKERDFSSKLNERELNVLTNQTRSLGSEVFKACQLDGTGIRIAVLDAGFRSVDKNPAFENIRNEKRIIKTWDFVKRNEFVYDYATHGTEVLSCIGGRLAGVDIGLAPGAEFLLVRTERMHVERFSEEENWLAGMEWADKNGADIINSSLGYTYDRYFREQMNGHVAFVARAANLAARKGILVVNASGNDGTDNDWKIIGTPADADSVLAVGGIDPDDLLHVDFSSYGPTSDKRLKPNVCAFGMVVGASPKGFEPTQGTSFSSPLVAGFAACAWQANRQLSNMALFREIEKAGHLYPYFDYAHGFGVPQASFYLSGHPNTKPTFDLLRDGKQLKVQLRSGVLQDTTGNRQQLVPVNFRSKDYLYYHVANSKGILDKYYVVEVLHPEVLTIDLEAFKPGTVIRFFYRGYLKAYTL